jgi:hypothetical protein
MNPSTPPLVRVLLARRPAACLAGMTLTLGLLSGCVAEDHYHRPRGPVVMQAPPPPPPAMIVVQSPPPPPPSRGGFVIEVREPPPPPRREAVRDRERPSNRHIWVAGYWRHDRGGYDWVPGHWEQPPRDRRTWVEPRWENRGGVHVFIEGTWR